MITYDVYTMERKSRKVMTLNEHDVASLIRERAHLLFPDACLNIVTTVEIEENKEAE